jgi:glycolate oxidase iron-sulfur subunit
LRDADAVLHLDRCLGCRGCETACPSGVAYGELIEAARPWVEARHRRPLVERWRRHLTLVVLTTPRVVRVLLAPLRLLDALGVLAWIRRRAPRLPSALAMAVSLVPPLVPRADLPAASAPADGERATVHLVPGCVMPELFGDTVRHTADVLVTNGCRVVVPAGQHCCGALALHAGDRVRALAEARRTLDALVAATPGTGRGAADRRDRRWLRRHDEGVGRALRRRSRPCRRGARGSRGASAMRPSSWRRSASASLRPGDRSGASPITIPVTRARAGVRSAPRDLLAAIPGITLVPMEDEDLCCGSAGHYNVMQPAMARALVARKVAAIRASGADLVATANAGCALQLEAGLRAAGVTTPVRHVLDLLAEAYEDRTGAITRTL